MTVAVLKNRLLAMTDKAFREQDWGVETIREFVELLAPAVQFDDGPRPALVTLDDSIRVDDLPKPTAGSTARRAGRWRVREDLWNAILDSEQQYLWIDERAVLSEVPETGHVAAPVLPTVSGETLSSWREAFVDARRASTDEDVQARLEHWASGAVSSAILPPRDRSAWFDDLKHRVRDRLETWFAANNIESPTDWLTTTTTRANPVSDDLELVRTLAIRTIQRMTPEELRALTLPAVAVARIAR